MAVTKINLHKVGGTMFLDRVTITIKAGNGGDGHTSFFRSKLVMNGGPVVIKELKQ